MGAWILYGLGTENQDLPGFIIIRPSSGHGGQDKWSSSFLPGDCQGTAIGNANVRIADISKEPISYLTAKELLAEHQRCELDMLQSMNRLYAEMRQKDPELEARIQAFELAFPCRRLRRSKWKNSGQEAFRSGVASPRPRTDPW